MTKLIIILGLLFVAFLFIAITAKTILSTIGGLLTSKGMDKTLSAGIGFWFILLSLGYLYPLWSLSKENFDLNLDTLGLLNVSLICLAILFFGFCVRFNVTFEKYHVNYDFSKHNKCPQCQSDNSILTKLYYESNKDDQLSYYQNRNDILFAPPKTLVNQSLPIGLISAILIGIGVFVASNNPYATIIIGAVIFVLTYFVSRKLLNEPSSFFDENSNRRRFWEYSVLCRNCGKRFIHNTSDNA